MGDVSRFLATPDHEVLRQLVHFSVERGTPQVMAWDRSLHVLREQLRDCLPEVGGCGIVLEFELPRSGGARPDLILLENGCVLVVEFKNRVEVEPGDLEQVNGYVLHLRDYHAGCRGKNVVPILIPIGYQGQPRFEKGVEIIPPHGLAALVRRYGPRPADAAAWARAPYEAQPALVEAARLLFERQPLPRIRSVEDARLPETIAKVNEILRHAIQSGKRVLVLLAGVPGSGKTLAGLQIAHSRDLGTKGLFLSGNGPLVQVLRHSLHERREFVEDIHAFIREHLIRAKAPALERVLVFDEAQRAWDRDQVLAKHAELSDSEPGLLFRIADMSEGGHGIVALLGEGQEIHVGEEGGLAMWAKAARDYRGWKVVGPQGREKEFLAAGVEYQAEPLLELTSTLRSPRATNLANWVSALLDGRVEQARKLAMEIKGNGYILGGARHLEPLRSFARNRYEGALGKRYGLIISERYRKAHEELGIRVARHPFYYYGQWFDDPPSSPRSACRLDLAVSEFGCQGLELDLPIMLWGPDIVWSEGVWNLGRHRKNPKVRDQRRLRLNAYRVLLTRGRDGLLIYVPPYSDAVWEILEAAGVSDMT
jgi:hypothetical protein